MFIITYRVGLRPKRSIQIIAGIVANILTTPVKINISKNAS